MPRHGSRDRRLSVTGVYYCGLSDTGALLFYRFIETRGGDGNWILEGRDGSGCAGSSINNSTPRGCAMLEADSVSIWRELSAESPESFCRQKTAVASLICNMGRSCEGTRFFCSVEELCESFIECGWVF